VYYLVEDIASLSECLGRTARQAVHFEKKAAVFQQELVEAKEKLAQAEARIKVLETEKDGNAG